MGGLEVMKERNEKKAKLLYDYLDQSKLFKGTVEKKDRSLMNVPFVTGSDELDAKFVKEAKEAGVKRVVAHIPEGVEVSVRRNQDTDYVFVQNFNRQPVEVKLPVEQYPVWLGKYDGTIDRFGTVVLKGKAGEKE